MTVITQLTGGGQQGRVSTGGEGQHERGKIGPGGPARARGGTGEEGPGKGKLDRCIMHQVHTSIHYHWCGLCNWPKCEPITK